MSAKIDFFISYTQQDRGWAEWIAWQLEAAGFTTTLQAWDFQASGNFVVEMNQATQRAVRTIAVLSDAYLASGFTTAEWAAAFRQDALGQKKTLIPIRVSECRPDGLLGAIIYLDLLGLEQATARDRLITTVGQIVHGQRAKPQQQPVFPGAARPQAPVFPGGTASTAPSAAVQSKPAPPVLEALPPLFFVIAAKEDLKAYEQLKLHLASPLRLGRLRLWNPEEVAEGQAIAAQVEQRFAVAVAFVLLVTPRLMAKEFALVERAMKQTKARVVPLLVDPANIADEEFHKLRALPRDGRPIHDRARSADQETAWTEVAKSILELAKQLSPT